MRHARLFLVLILLLAVGGCGGTESSSRIDQDENVGPGPGLLELSHGGAAWPGSLPLWSVWAGGVLIADGANLSQFFPILIDVSAVPIGTTVEAFGFNTIGAQITYASGPLGPMGVVLQMP